MPARPEPASSGAVIVDVVLLLPGNALAAHLAWPRVDRKLGQLDRGTWVRWRSGSLGERLPLRLFDDLDASAFIESDPALIPPAVEDLGGRLVVPLLLLDLGEPGLELGNLLGLPVETLLAQALLLAGLVDLRLGAAPLGSELEHVVGLALRDYSKEE